MPARWGLGVADAAPVPATAQHSPLPRRLQLQRSHPTDTPEFKVTASAGRWLLCSGSSTGPLWIHATPH